MSEEAVEAAEVTGTPPKGKVKKKGDKKGAKKGDDGKKGGKDAGLSIANHPRARQHVKRSKGWGGLAGFAIAAYLSYRAGVPTVQIGIRALAAGWIGYMLAWACSVTIWRHLVMAELRGAYERAQASAAGGEPEVGTSAPPDQPR